MGPEQKKIYSIWVPGGGIVGQLDGDGISLRGVLCTTQKIYLGSHWNHKILDGPRFCHLWMWQKLFYVFNVCVNLFMLWNNKKQKRKKNITLCQLLLHLQQLEHLGGSSSTSSTCTPGRQRSESRVRLKQQLLLLTTIVILQLLYSSVCEDLVLALKGS